MNTVDDHMDALSDNAVYMEIDATNSHSSPLNLTLQLENLKAWKKFWRELFLALTLLMQCVAILQAQLIQAQNQQ